MRRSPERWAGVMSLVVAVAATACVSPSGNATAVPRAGRSLDVSAELDAAHAASASIGPGGGTLTATGADGTVFTLTVARNALAGAIPITMTPIRSLQGLPLRAGLAGAVHFDPDGLALIEPARLTIQPARPIPPSARVAFGYYGNGRDFHLLPLMRGPTIELLVWHFSGGGVGEGSVQDAGAIAPASPEARYQQQLAEAIAKAGDRPLEEVVAPIIAQANETYEKDLQQTIRHGCDDAGGVGPAVLAFDNQQELLGTGRRPSLLGSQDFADADDGCAEMWRRKLDEACAEGDTTKIHKALLPVLAAKRSEVLRGRSGAGVEDLMQRMCEAKGWKGTIRFTRITAEHSDTSSHDETFTQSVTLSRTVSAETTASDANFTIEGTATAESKSTDTESTHSPPPACGLWQEYDATTTINFSAAGKVEVRLFTTRGSISGSVTSDVKFDVTGKIAVTGRRKPNGCGPPEPFHEERDTVGLQGGLGAFTFEGSIDPAHPDMANGISRTTVLSTTTTVEWSLIRER